MLLAGRDVIGIAATGSGKTLAFLIPGLIKISTKVMLLLLLLLLLPLPLLILLTLLRRFVVVFHLVVPLVLLFLYWYYHHHHHHHHIIIIIIIIIIMKAPTRELAMQSHQVVVDVSEAGMNAGLGSGTIIIILL